MMEYKVPIMHKNFLAFFLIISAPYSFCIRSKIQEAITNCTVPGNVLRSGKRGENIIIKVIQNESDVKTITNNLSFFRVSLLTTSFFNKNNERKQKYHKIKWKKRATPNILNFSINTGFNNYIWSIIWKDCS